MGNSKEYIQKLHGDSKGYITRAEIKDNIYSQWHYTIGSLAEQDFTGENTYISQNTFYKPQRRIENIKELKSLYIDLDTYNTLYTSSQILLNLQENYFNQSIPRPNLVVNSGRGLYLEWTIKSAPYKALPLWKAIEEYLYKQLKEFGADNKALDPTRVLRVVGTINSKSNTRVEVLQDYNYLYDLREIQQGFLPELQEKKVKTKGRPKKIYSIYRERSLYYARIKDITMICELREYDLKGHREVILFLYRYYLCYFTQDTEQALQDTIDLNSEFKRPLNEREVKGATKSAEKVFLSQNKQYKYTNKKLIEILSITEKEQEYLITIIGQAEYMKRNNEYNKKKYIEKLKADGKMTKKEELEQTRAKIKSLREKGFKNKDIMITLGIDSTTTFERHIKVLKEQGLI